MDVYLSSHFWRRHPDTSNREAEPSWACVIHFHSCIGRREKGEAEPRLCVCGTHYKTQIFISYWMELTCYSKCSVSDVSFLGAFGNTFAALTGSDSESFSYANCYIFWEILLKNWFLLYCSTMLPIKKKKTNFLLCFFWPVYISFDLCSLCYHWQFALKYKTLFSVQSSFW